MALTIGEPAPDFSLYNTEKELVNLANLRGQKVLLLFFPLAFTSVCTAELCAVRDNLKVYESLNVLPLGISVDSLHTLKKFKEEQHLNFPLLSDFNKEISTLYKSIYEEFGFGMKGVSKRAAFLINEDGMVEYAEVLDNAGEQPNFEAIKKILAKVPAN